MTTSCRTTSATRRSRTVWAAVSTAFRAAASQDSLLTPITSVTRYTLSAMSTSSIKHPRGVPLTGSRSDVVEFGTTSAHRNGGCVDALPARVGFEDGAVLRRSRRPRNRGRWPDRAAAFLALQRRRSGEARRTGRTIADEVVIAGRLVFPTSCLEGIEGIGIDSGLTHSHTVLCRIPRNRTRTEPPRRLPP